MLVSILKGAVLDAPELDEIVDVVVWFCDPEPDELDFSAAVAKVLAC